MYFKSDLEIFHTAKARFRQTSSLKLEVQRLRRTVLSLGCSYLIRVTYCRMMKLPERYEQLVLVGAWDLILFKTKSIIIAQQPESACYDHRDGVEEFIFWSIFGPAMLSSSAKNSKAICTNAVASMFPSSRCKSKPLTKLSLLYSSFRRRCSGPDVYVTFHHFASRSKTIHDLSRLPQAISR